MPRFGQRHIYLMAVHWTIMLISELILTVLNLSSFQSVVIFYSQREGVA